MKGRPRDSKREDAIAAAAISLIQEVGYERCTIEAIALKAGVSKAIQQLVLLEQLSP